MQYQRYVGGLAEAIEVVDVQSGLDFFPGLGGTGNGAVDVADGHGEPVGAGLPDEARGLVVRVDGMAPIDEVTAAIEGALAGA